MTIQPLRDADLNIPGIDIHRTLLWTARAFERAVDQALAPLGLSNAKFAVLLTIGYAGDRALTISQIGRQIDRVERVNLTSVLDNLERDGLIRREKHPTDRRALVIKLTEKGTRIRDEAKVLYIPTVTELAKRLSEPDLEVLTDLLSRLGNL